MLQKQRESNLELLRIVSMLLVMLLHYLPLRNPTTASLLIENPLKALLNLELKSIAIVCVHCFILISGYFGIKWKLRSFGNLLFQLLFWAFAGFFIAKYLIEPFIHLNISNSFSSFLTNISYWYLGRWFVSAYLCLYILSPLINSFVDNSTNKQLLNFIIVFYSFSTIYGWIFRCSEFEAGTSAISLVGLYTIGKWLRISNYKPVIWNKWFDLLGFFICTLIMTGFSAILILVGVESSIYGYLNPIVILESIFLFQFFRKINIETNRWINFFAASAFSAYLLHYHPFVIEYFHTICKSMHKFDFALIYVVGFIIATFMLSVIIDKIRILLWQAFIKLYHTVYQYFTPRKYTLTIHHYSAYSVPLC